MVIDLTRSGILKPELSKIMAANFDEIRDSYTKYVERLASANKLRGLEWLVGVSCRNVGATDVFVIFSRVKLLLYVLERGLAVTEILVDSRGMRDLVEQVVRKHGISPNIRYRRKDRYCVVIVLRNVLISIYLAVIKIVASKLSGSGDIPVRSIVYAETILYKDSFDSNGKFKEPYYPGMEDQLPRHIKDCLWYAPCAFYRCRSLWNILGLMRLCNKDNKKYLIKEQWLTIGDYIWAIAKALTLGKSIRSVPVWNNYDISKVIDYEISKQAGSGWLVEPLLLYRFISRLKKKDVRIKFVLDWNENQQIDRALCLAMRKYYPGVPISGYQGYVVSQRFVSHDLTDYEVKAETTPDRLFVISERLVIERKRYCKELDVRTAPAFRFQPAIDFINAGVHKDIILVGCPIQPLAASSILKLCLEAVIPKKYKVVIKKHPLTSKEEFFNQVPEASNKLFQVDGRNSHDIFQSTTLLVSFDSTICIEAAVCGIPVAVVAEPTRGGNPLVGRVDETYWSEVYSAADLTAAIARHEKSNFPKISGFFVPVTGETVSTMFQSI